MRKGIIVSILTLFIFLVVTMVTSKNYSMADGDENYGFPFTFYKYIGGKLIDPNSSNEHFSSFYLIIDIIVSIMIALLFTMLFYRIRKKRF